MTLKGSLQILSDCKMGNGFTLEAPLEEQARAYWMTPPSKRGQIDNLVKAYTDARTNWVMDTLEAVGIDFDKNKSWNLVVDYSDNTGIPPVDLIIWQYHESDPEFDLEEQPDPETDAALKSFASVLLERGLQGPRASQYGGAVVEDVTPTSVKIGRYSEEGKQGFLESINEVREENNLPPLNEAQSEEVLAALFAIRGGFAELEAIKGSPIEED